ncbi:hypothetical protein H4R35_006845, partial [Dimargaris xerosporica]
MTTWRDGSGSGAPGVGTNNPLSSMFHPAATSPHRLQTPAHVLATYNQLVDTTLPMDWDPAQMPNGGASASPLPASQTAKAQMLPLSGSDCAPVASATGTVSHSALEQQFFASMCDWARGAPGSAGLISPLGIQPSLMFSNPSNQAGVTDFSLSNQGFAPAFVTPLTDFNQVFSQND